MSLLDLSAAEKKFLADCVAARRAAMEEAILDAFDGVEHTLFAANLAMGLDLFSRLCLARRRDLEAEAREARSAQ